MAGSDMDSERGRDAGIGGAGTDRKGAESSGNKASRDGDRSRSAATKSKMADMQSFGATPTSAEPSKKEAAELGDAIDRLNAGKSGVGGFFGDLLGIRQEVAMNPNTGSWDVKSIKEVNPLGAAIGMVAGSVAGPFGSAAVQAGLGAIGFEDPLGFEIDLGFGGATAKGVKDDNPDRHDRKVVSKAGNPSAAKAVDAKTQEESAIDKAVKQLLEGDKKFNFFDMPQFSLLDPNFGKDQQNVNLAELLLQGNPLKKETA